MNNIQVFVIGQQSLFRMGIGHLLSDIDDMEFAGAADSTEDVVANLETLLPDVVIMDIDGSSENGLSLTRKIKQRLPNIGVIVLTTNHNDTQLFQALKAQAAAYLNKGITADELVNTIRRVARGEHPINETFVARPNVASQVLQQFQELTWQSETRAFMSPLTPREIEILNYIAQGYLNKQIAIELGISEQTIKNHVTSILRKLNANARTDAVVLAIKQGLISIK